MQTKRVPLHLHQPTGLEVMRNIMQINSEFGIASCDGKQSSKRHHQQQGLTRTHLRSTDLNTN